MAASVEPPTAPDIGENTDRIAGIPQEDSAPQRMPQRSIHPMLEPLNRRPDMSATSAYGIEIDAANVAAAVILESRLSRLAPTTAGLGSNWIVEVPGPVNLEDVEAVVSGWLDDLGQPSTTMRIDNRVLRLEGHRPTRKAPSHRATNWGFIG